MQRYAELAANWGLEQAAEQPACSRQRAHAAVAAYRNSAAALTKSRQTRATNWPAAVTARVRALGMPNARFVVAVEPAAAACRTRTCDDLVRFDFSANPGQPPRAAGESRVRRQLSRVSLALQ